MGKCQDSETDEIDRPKACYRNFGPAEKVHDTFVLDLYRYMFSRGDKFDYQYFMRGMCEPIMATDTKHTRIPP